MKRAAKFLALAALFLTLAATSCSDKTNYSERAYAKQSKGDLDGAIADYSQAIKLKPGLARQ